MTNQELYQWQQDFRAAPCVFCTFDGDGMLVAIYESREAAEIEVAACPPQRTIHGTIHRPTIRAINVHSLELARRRWAREREG